MNTIILYLDPLAKKSATSWLVTSHLCRTDGYGEVLSEDIGVASTLESALAVPITSLSDNVHEHTLTIKEIANVE